MKTDLETLAETVDPRILTDEDERMLARGRKLRDRHMRRKYSRWGFWRNRADQPLGELKEVEYYLNRRISKALEASDIVATDVFHGMDVFQRRSSCASRLRARLLRACKGFARWSAKPLEEFANKAPRDRASGMEALPAGGPFRAARFFFASAHP